MTNEAIRLYTERLRLRYKKSTKREKGAILDEYCQVCEISRKHGIRKLSGSRSVSEKRRGARAFYDFHTAHHLGRLWKVMGRMCSKRMKAAIHLWLPYDQSPGLTEDIRRKLMTMSSSTMDRLLRPFRHSWKRGKSATKPGSLIKSKIPIELLTAKVTEPGFVEADTVAHCGNSLLGKFAYSLTVTDLYSGWTENRACWTKASSEVLSQIKHIRSAMPFRIKGFSCDNGSEFINHDLLKYFHQSESGRIKFTRKRPYHKNDACHVEQKNDTHVRQLFGYARLDNEALLNLMNDIYANYWNVLQNHFYPNMKLVRKTRVGARVRKIYDTPKTAYERLLESKKLTELQATNLQMTHLGINPLELQKTLEQKVRLFHSQLTIDQITGGPEEPLSA